MRKTTLILLAMVGIVYHILANTSFAYAVSYPVVIQEGMNLGDSNRYNVIPTFSEGLPLSDEASKILTSPLGVTLGLGAEAVGSANQVGEGMQLSDDVMNMMTIIQESFSVSDSAMRSFIGIDIALDIVDVIPRLGFTYAMNLVDVLDLEDKLRPLNIFSFEDVLTIQDTVISNIIVIVEVLPLRDFQSYIESLKITEAIGVSDSALLNFVLEETLSLIDVLGVSKFASMVTNFYSVLINELVSLQDSSRVLNTYNVFINELISARDTSITVLSEHVEAAARLFTSIISESLGLRMDQSSAEVTGSELSIYPRVALIVSASSIIVALLILFYKRTSTR